jgi:hypothetical protein
MWQKDGPNYFYYLKPRDLGREDGPWWALVFSRGEVKVDDVAYYDPSAWETFEPPVLSEENKRLAIERLFRFVP